MSEKSFNLKTIFSLFWSFIDLMSKQGVQLIVQIVLARILLPEDFGLIGMLTIFIAISMSIIQGGLDQALIREDNPKKKDYSTVFYFNLFISIIIYLTFYLIAPIIADFYNEPRLINILRVIMVVIIINAFGMIQRVMLIKKLNFKTQTKISLISGFISGCSAIIMALNGFGVWSLVFQRVIMQLLEMLLLCFSNQWFPSKQFDIKLFKYYFTFGYRILISGLIDTIFKNIYLVIIGKIYPVNQLGYVTNATKLRDISTSSISKAIQNVTYPALSNIKDNDKSLMLNYRNIVRMSSFLYFPFIFGIVAIAPTFIPFLLGDKWTDSVIYFQILSLAGVFYPLHAINLNILKVKNRADIFLYLEIIKKIVLSILLILAIIFTDNIKNLLLVFIVQSYIALIINSYYSGKEISYSLIQQLKDISPSFLISIAMSIIVFLSNFFLHGAMGIKLIEQIIIGFIIYVIFVWLAKIKEFIAIYNLIVSFLRREKER